MRLFSVVLALLWALHPCSAVFAAGQGAGQPPAAGTTAADEAADEALSTNAVFAERILEELATIEEAWSRSLNRTLTLTSRSYGVASDPSHLNAMEEDLLRRMFCVGAGQDNGIQVATIRGLNLGFYGSVLKLSPTSDIPQRLKRLEQIASSVASRTESLAVTCAYFPEKLTKESMVQFLAALDPTVKFILTETPRLIQELIPIRDRKTAAPN